MRFPKLFNLRLDPFERADITSNTYWDWVMDHIYLFLPAQKYVGEFLMTFKEYPPARRRRASPLTRCCRSSWAAPVAINVVLIPADSPGMVDLRG